MNRTLPIALALLLAVAAGSACSRKDGGGGGSEQATLLATLLESEAPSPAGPSDFAGAHAGLSPTGIDPVFGERGGVAFARGGAEGFQIIHDGRPGRSYAAVSEVTLSPDGRRCAHGALRDGKWRVVLDGAEHGPYDGVRAIVFSADGAHLAWQVKDGERWKLAVDGRVRPGRRGSVAGQAFAASGTRIVFVDELDGQGNGGKLVVSDVALGSETTVTSGVASFRLAGDGARLAAVATAGTGQAVISLAPERPERVETGPVFDAVEALAGSRGGDATGYVALRGGKRMAVLGAREEPLAEWIPLEPPVVRPGRPALGLLAGNGGWVTFRELLAEAGPPEPFFEAAEGLTYSADGSAHAYAGRRGQNWYVVVNGKEGPAFDRVISPVLTPDGRRVVYRARQRGARFVVIADATGRTVKRLPTHEQVFPVHVAADGKSVGYGVKDDRRLSWMAEGL